VTDPTSAGVDTPAPHLADLDDEALRLELEARARRRSDEAGSAPRRRWPVIVGALVLLATIALAVLAYLDARDLQSDADVRDDVAAAATGFADAYYSFSADDLEASRDRVVGLMTEEFAGQYNELFDAGIGQLITELDATLQAEILDVFVAEVDGDEAQAIVSANTSASSPQGTFDLTGYILVAMEREGGEWLVSSVLTLAPPVSEADQGESIADPAGG
jgi:hypothetical protein